MKLERLDTHTKILGAIEKSVIPFTLFGSPHVLNTFFNNTGFELWSAEFENETYIFVRKVDRKFVQNELRLLFKKFPDELVDQLKKEFDPPYIAYNELLEDQHDERQIEDIEVVVDVKKYVDLAYAPMRKHYKQAVKHNSSLEIKEFKNIPIEHLQEFWKSWLAQRAERPYAADRTHNDAKFFNIYSDQEYFGVVAYEGDRIVAYSIGIGFDEGKCISVFNKCLQGYTNLGLQISYEKALLAEKKGYNKIALGGINNDFKKQFLHIADTMLLYGIELFRKPDFTTKSPNGYTYALFF